MFGDAWSGDQPKYDAVHWEFNEGRLVALRISILAPGVGASGLAVAELGKINGWYRSKVRQGSDLLLTRIICLVLLLEDKEDTAEVIDAVVSL